MADLEGSIRPYCARGQDKMAELAIVRAAHLHFYIDELREIGVPVERELARSRLPTWALEDPDVYVSYELCLEWLASCSSDLELMEFGYRASRRESLTSLDAPFQRAILDAPTGLARFQTFLRCASLEDNVLSIRMQPEGDQVRVITTMEGFENNPFIGLGEWVDLQVMISIVQSFVGPCWRPQEMTFVSHQPLTPSIQEAFPNTRILTGQPNTSILVDTNLLARPCHPVLQFPDSKTGHQPNGTYSDSLAAWDLPAALGAAVRAYLADGYPDVHKMAEVFGMSERTLQRRLHQFGSTYSNIVQVARFNLACELLTDPSAKIIDVAFAVGYESPQHFARAFRRYSGLSPTLFRSSLAETN
jgi:AraC-like DNA-binding protein